MYCDYHVHSAYSDDSSYELEKLIQDAINKGLDEICITDHVDYGIKKDIDEGEITYRDGYPLTNVDYPSYYQEILKLRVKYPQINIKLGLEFGIQTHTIPKYKQLFKQYPFDFIILSCHQINDQEFWTQEFQANKTQDQYQQEYYQEIKAIISEYKDYSVLGHLDLLNRYDLKGDYPFNKIKDIVSDILKIVIKDGKGIEVNTSSYRYQLKDTTPSINILKLYKELGGTIITIGSDSHQEDHLGAYINETKQILKELGFKYYCTYDKMEVQYHPIGE